MRRTLTDRIVALAQSHDLLAEEQGKGVPLAQIIERVISPYARHDRVVLSGKPVRLPANTVEMLGLAFHELATNAAKHGALSGRKGRVEITWTTRCASKASYLLEIIWRERGGPPVVAPTRRGFGSRLLERGIPHDFGGTVTLHFHPEGLECRIGLPVASGG